MKQKIIKQGTITEALPRTIFRVKLIDDTEALCHLAGKLRLYKIKLLPGDRVTVELSIYDSKRGRIIFRN